MRKRVLVLIMGLLTVGAVAMPVVVSSFKCYANGSGCTGGGQCCSGECSCNNAGTNCTCVKNSQ